MKPSRAILALGVAGAVLVGVLTATQSRINSELSRALGDGYLAAVISFGSGLVIMLIVLAVWAPGRRGVRRLAASVRGRATPWWYLVGGAGRAASQTSGGQFVLLSIHGIAVSGIPSDMTVRRGNCCILRNGDLSSAGRTRVAPASPRFVHQSSDLGRFLILPD